MHQGHEIRFFPVVFLTQFEITISTCNSPHDPTVLGTPYITVVYNACSVYQLCID